MNVKKGLLITCSIAFSANVYAAITCTEPVLSKPKERGSVYYFESVVHCELINENVNIKGLKDAYRTEILNPKSQFKMHSQNNYKDKNGMQGYAFDVTQSYQSEQGHLDVRANLLLMDDNDKNFSYQFQSTKIVGEDDAAYNRSIVNKVDVQFQPNKTEVTSFKSIEVEEPWYAPDSMFFDTVEPDLAKASKNAAMLNARKIAGENVEALRK